MKNYNTIERTKEISDYIEYYFQNFKVGLSACGIGSTQDTELTSGFWEYLHDYMREVKEILYEKLTNKTLIDLGVGASGSNIPSFIEVPFTKYVGVDIDRPYANALYAIKKMQEKGLDASLVNSDMLLYLIGLDDNSANFLLGAIDSDVILDDKYWQYLCEELYRCTEDGGIIIDAGVGRIEFYLNKMLPGKFKLIYDQMSLGGQKIFEKIK